MSVSSASQEDSQLLEALPQSFRLYHRLRSYVESMQRGSYVRIIDANGHTSKRFASVSGDCSALSLSDHKFQPCIAVIYLDEVTDVVPRDSVIELHVGADAVVRIMISSPQSWQAWYHGLAFLANENEWFRSVRDSLPPSPAPVSKSPATAAFLPGPDEDPIGRPRLGPGPGPKFASFGAISSNSADGGDNVESLKLQLEERDETIRRLISVIRFLSAS
eukprot:ANDGO_03499.mRNA.1 hypothetical protein